MADLNRIKEVLTEQKRTGKWLAGELNKSVKGLMQMKDDSFSAWYEADCWLFGLIYYVLFIGKSLRDDFTREMKSGKKQTMQEEITHYIKTLKNTDGYLKNANRLGNVLNRLVKSCEIIGKYVQ